MSATISTPAWDSVSRERSVRGQLASELEAQRNHVLGEPHRETLYDGAPIEPRRTEPADPDAGFESLGADAELDQLIFDGASFGTATPAGSGGGNG